MRNFTFPPHDNTIQREKNVHIYIHAKKKYTSVPRCEGGNLRGILYIYWNVYWKKYSQQEDVDSDQLNVACSVPDLVAQFLHRK